MQVAAIGVVQAYTDRLMRELGPLLEERYGSRADARADAASVTRTDRVELGEVFDRVREGELTQPFLERMFHLVDQQAANDLQRVVPVPMKDTLPRAAELQREWIDRNTSLIRLEQRARQEVARIVDAPIREGVRVEEIRDRIQARMNVVRSRAELIARDQTLKLYGQIQEERQTQAGIEEYVWSTSLDERVRGNPAGLYPKSHGNHWKLEGRTFRWDDPPVVDEKSGRKEHPGGDFQCRCAAIPVLSDDLEPISEVRPSVRVRGEPANDIPEELPPEPGPDPVDLERERLAEERAAREAERERQAAERAAAEETARLAREAELARARQAAAARPVGLESHLSQVGEAFIHPQAETKLNAILGKPLDAKSLDAVIGRSLVQYDKSGAPPVTEVVAHTQDGVEYVNVSLYGGDELKVSRNFFRDTEGDLVVKHDLLTLPDYMQGRGLGSQVILDQLEAYERAGVDRIELDAAWIGKYQWPKLGFELTDEADRMPYYRDKFLRYLRAHDIPNAESIAAEAGSLRDIAIERIGARQIGKEFLIGETGDSPRLIEKLVMKVRPGTPTYERMKTELRNDVAKKAR